MSPNDLVLHHMGSFVPTLAFTPHNKVVGTDVLGATVVVGTVVDGAAEFEPPHDASPDTDTRGNDARKA